MAKRASLVARVGLDGGDEFLRDLKELGLIGEKAFKDIERAAADVKSLSPLAKRIKELRREMELASKKFTEVGQSMRRVGQQMSTAITLPIAAIGAASLKAFADFEAGMASVSTLVDTSTESMREMEQAVLDLSGRVPVSLSDLTAALYQVRSAGVDAGDAMQVLERSARLGVAGLGTTEQAVDLVTSALNAFNLSGEEAARVYDVIFSTVQFGKTDIAQLSQGFGAVALTVSEAGIEFSEFQAIVAALTGAGIPASQVYSQMRAVIGGLTRDTKETVKVFDALGVKTFKELVQTSGGVVQALKRIDGVLDGNAAAIVKLFGSLDAYNAVIGVTGSRLEAFETAHEAMLNDIGAVDVAFEKQAATVRSAFQQIINAVDRVRILIGGDLVPTFREAAATILDLGKAFAELEPETRKAGIVIAAIAAAAGPVIIGLGLLSIAIGALLTVTGGVVVGVTALTGVLVGLYAGFQDVRDVVGVLWSLFRASPLGSFIGAQGDARQAADDHAAALNELKTALAAAKSGAEDSIKAYNDLAAAKIEAAKEAVALARAELEAAKAIAEARRRTAEASAAGASRLVAGVGPVLRMLVGAAEREADIAEDALDAALTRLSEFEATIGAAEPFEPLVEGAAQLGDAAEEVADRAVEAGHRIRVFGPGGQLRADLEKKAGKTVLDETEDDADDATEAIGRTEKAVEDLKSAVVDPSLNLASAIEPGQIVTTVEKVEELNKKFQAAMADIKSGSADAAKSTDSLADAAKAAGDVEFGLGTQFDALSGDFDEAASTAEGASGRVSNAFAEMERAGAGSLRQLEEAFTAATAGINASLASISGDASDVELGGGSGADDLAGGGPFAGLQNSITATVELIRTVDFSPLRDGAVAAFAAIEERAVSAVATIQAALATLGTGGGGGGEETEGEEGGEGAVSGGAFGALAASAQTAWATITEGAVALQATLQGVFAAIVAAVHEMFAALADTITGLFQGVKGQIDDIASQIRDVVNDLIAEMERLVAAAKEALAAVNEAKAAGGGAAGFARGGYLRSGPGTSTSDSIPAWLSRGEFVIRAAAVQKFGPAFFAALNSMRLPDFPRFNAGGIVDGISGSLAGLALPSPAIANVTVNGGGEGRDRVPIVLPSGAKGDAYVERSFADQMERETVGQQYRSAGRAPGWMRPRSIR